MNQHTHNDKSGPQRDVSLLYLTDCGEFNPQSGLFYNLDSKTLPELQYNWLTKQSNASSILMTLHELKFLELAHPKFRTPMVEKISTATSCGVFDAAKETGHSERAPVQQVLIKPA